MAANQLAACAEGRLLWFGGPAVESSRRSMAAMFAEVVGVVLIPQKRTSFSTMKGRGRAMACLSVGDESIAGTDDQRQHQQAQPPAPSALPGEEDRSDHDGGRKQFVAARERHDLVEDRISQRVVDEPEQRRVP